MAGKECDIVETFKYLLILIVQGVQVAGSLVLKSVSHPSVLHCYLSSAFPGFPFWPVSWWVWVVGGLGREQKEDQRNAALSLMDMLVTPPVTALTGGAHLAVSGCPLAHVLGSFMSTCLKLKSSERRKAL